MNAAKPYERNSSHKAIDEIIVKYIILDINYYSYLQLKIKVFFYAPDLIFAIIINFYAL
ncbi:Uncharacterised protein [Budvicia aquatica]|uniref:Uncharacterized protein n=1 Tax=Budvicia aquatica TaxID=82979 RepID=A0A484ZIT6_9GAMM|nr:Uncharacterised protein [Budvicia aquatica]